jgi:putative sporulation protein YtaF
MPLRLFGSLWLGISTNIDNFGVGVAYGIKRIRIGMMSNLLIAFFNATGTLVAMTAGETVSTLLPATISGYIGNSIIILVGIWGLTNTFGFWGSDAENTSTGEPREIIQLEYIAQHPEILDPNRSGHVKMRECLPLAFALSISNLATGIGAGLAGYNVGFLVLIMFIFSMLGISLGYFFGRKCSLALPGKWPGILSGVLLIALGVYEMLF